MLNSAHYLGFYLMQLKPYLYYGYRRDMGLRQVFFFLIVFVFNIFPSLFLGMFLHDYSYDPPHIHLLLLFLLLTVIFVINNYCSEEKICVIYNTW